MFDALLLRLAPQGPKMLLCFDASCILNNYDPIYLYTSGKHKKDINKVQKGRKNIVQKMKRLNHRISYYSQHSL